MAVVHLVDKAQLPETLEEEAEIIQVVRAAAGAVLLTAVRILRVHLLLFLAGAGAGAGAEVLPPVKVA
jgi:hypothetical protein